MILGETRGPAIWYVRHFDASFRRRDAVGSAIGFAAPASHLA
jgi:hypothetical protein